jgi:hypothetical protein
MNAPRQESNVIAERLHLATGFLSCEREWVIRRLAELGSRLRSFQDTRIDLAISLRERRRAGQRVTLECWIDRTPRLHLVSTSMERELAAALNEVRDDLIRQVDDARTLAEPGDDRAERPPRHDR